VGRTHWSIRRWIRLGRLARYQSGPRIYVRRDELLELVLQRKRRTRKGKQIMDAQRQLDANERFVLEHKHCLILLADAPLTTLQFCPIGLPLAPDMEALIRIQAVSLPRIAGYRRRWHSVFAAHGRAGPGYPGWAETGLCPGCTSTLRRLVRKVVVAPTGRGSRVRR